MNPPRSLVVGHALSTYRGLDNVVHVVLQATGRINANGFPRWERQMLCGMALSSNFEPVLEADPPTCFECLTTKVGRVP